MEKIVERVKEYVRGCVSEERWRSVHGLSHWRRVEMFGLRMAEKEERVDRLVVRLFAYLHDFCRVNDWRDIEHGPRAAEKIKGVRESILGELSDEQFDALSQAIREHTVRSEPSGDITVDTCIDADRLDLGRVGITPDPERMLSCWGRELARNFNENEKINENENEKGALKGDGNGNNESGKGKERVDKELMGRVLDYVDKEILPRYDAFDGGHGREHVLRVIGESCNLAKGQDVRMEMVVLVAAFHDLGLKEGRERHHIVSGEILEKDRFVGENFSAEEVGLMKEAIEDHRASGKNPPRSIYGMIVAEADRDIEPRKIIERTMLYGKGEMPGAGFEELFERSKRHLREKYGEGGYVKLWMHSERNERGLRELREIIRDEERLRGICREIF